MFNPLESDTYYLHQLECFFSQKRDDFFPRAKLWIPLYLLNCYSLCLSRRGMCFGKFSTPLRPSRKKEAFWLVQQNASLASARLKPRKQRLFCLCEEEYKNFFLSNIPLADSHYMITRFWLSLGLHVLYLKLTRKISLKHTVVLKTEVRAVSLCRSDSSPMERGLLLLCAVLL